ncbi:MAG: hypothetical protein A3F33_03685 [Candidatus Woykebacteria bacterium RIFCSPHIGHO2_12_FULL_43_10]|uniref:Triosephosphate isomerase n=2 Tax=Candidatus Woykeibacteriota TaxID=1817899 RepID=A0A1G1WSY4_9BACT|nr:MAG: hypothetical protein A2802_01405 [Candidatus Woykebacteria bacterium RIFCSPHIGHO2_01_FULL_43_29]OGY28796.1 MAG: hypothetical protein A3J50_03550 [Candidatus Woykebacteria bacterium RIFCSPHIGHO2_02_FULL_43_16b]OGY30045.1 MAG: hypothetical protein A3F33_03685 [Candidatus Woykebacteria bacterium RIFCSPHIGHO2_12_FULL_43_10]OGY30855.1 MAG: hypothetical protein A3A61_04475 [Candidatus Woykebacteria bacterium RIFCSPLOWO2_01_FULL_43_14]
MEKLIVANWKAEKNISEASSWVKTIRHILEESVVKVVICPDFVSIPVVRGLLKDTSVGLGAQDISSEDKGPHTGEVVVDSLKGLVDYVILGHSERRSGQAETTTMIIKKVGHADRVGITPIVCFSSLEEVRDYHKSHGPTEKIYFAYEPLLAIGTDKPQGSEEAKKHLESFKEILGDIDLLYGGSVEENNVRSYLSVGFQGVLVGNASLNEEQFAKIVRIANDNKSL